MKEYLGKVGCKFYVYYKDSLGTYKHEIDLNNIEIRNRRFEIYDKGKIIQK